MVILGVIAGGIVVGAVTYDDYSGHSDHSDYSDAAVRRQKQKEMEMEALTQKKQDLANRLNDYKRKHINAYMDDSRYQEMAGTAIKNDAQMKEMDSFVKNKIKSKETQEVDVAVKDIREEIKLIDKTIFDLENIYKKYSEE